MEPEKLLIVRLLVLSGALIVSMKHELDRERDAAFVVQFGEGRGLTLYDPKRLAIVVLTVVVEILAAADLLFYLAFVHPMFVVYFIILQAPVET